MSDLQYTIRCERLNIAFAIVGRLMFSLALLMGFSIFTGDLVAGGWWDYAIAGFLTTILVGGGIVLEWTSLKDRREAIHKAIQRHERDQERERQMRERIQRHEEEIRQRELFRETIPREDNW